MCGWIGGGLDYYLLSKGWIKFALTNEACYEWTTMDTKLDQAEGTGPVIVGQIVWRHTMRMFQQNIFKMVSVTVLCPPGNKFLFSRVVVTPWGMRRPLHILPKNYIITFAGHCVYAHCLLSGHKKSKFKLYIKRNVQFRSRYLSQEKALHHPLCSRSNDEVHNNNLASIFAGT